jgi:hypothetical protein
VEVVVREVVGMVEVLVPEVSVPVVAAVPVVVDVVASAGFIGSRPGSVVVVVVGLTGVTGAFAVVAGGVVVVGLSGIIARAIFPPL